MSKICSGTTNPDSQIKLAQLQVERIKDEEEQWISGEELYTEGSSDDDDAALRAKRRHDERQGRIPKRNPKVSTPKNKSNLQEQKVLPAEQFVGVSLPENIHSEPETMNIAGVAANAHSCEAQQPFTSENDACDLLVEINDSEISWRPKRADIETYKSEGENMVNFPTQTEEIVTTVNTPKIASQQINSGYSFAEEAAALLQDINIKLKVFTDDQCDTEEFSQKMNLLQEFSEARERLTHISKQLGEIDILAKEEKTYPLQEDQIQNLVQKSFSSVYGRQSLTCSPTEQKENLLQSLNQDILEHILQEANMEMPHFQHRSLQK